MGHQQMIQRERELTSYLMEELLHIPDIIVLESKTKERMGIVSFVPLNIHYNLFTKLLNDRFGIQARGGCSCAGPYGHYLLAINSNTSRAITHQLDQGDLTNKPGWVRLSIHPTMTQREILTITVAIRSIMMNIVSWKEDYRYNPSNNDWNHKFVAYDINVGDLFAM
ncbi:Aminotransferase class-V [compost metagenome]